MELGVIFLVANRSLKPHQTVTNENTPVVLQQNILPMPVRKTFAEYCSNATHTFLDEHLSIGQKKLINVQHIVICLKGDLLLLKRTSGASYELLETTPTPAKKTPSLLIKTISHYVVRVHMVLAAALKQEISIGEISKHFLPLREELATLKRDYPDEVNDKLSMIDLTLSIIEDTLSAMNIDQIRDLHQIYLKETKPHHERYGRQATEYQLRGLKEIVSKWLDDYCIDLRSTYAIIVGARGPKQDMLEKQYFQALRRAHGIADANTSSGGIIYSEMLPEQMNVHYSVLIDDLARDLHNQDIAESILDNRDGMNKDILGHHAKLVLELSEKKQPLIPECGTGIWAGFWKQQEQGEPTSKCPFHQSR